MKSRRFNFYAFISFSIHAMRRLTIFFCWLSDNSLFFGTLYHLFRQPRQQQAQACWALKTGCPLIGVCLPSFGITAGARRVRIKSAAWERITFMSLLLTYSLSFSFRWKLDLNFDMFNFSKALSIVCIVLPSCYTSMIASSASSAVISSFRYWFLTCLALSSQAKYSSADMDFGVSPNNCARSIRLYILFFSLS